MWGSLRAAVDMFRAQKVRFLLTVSGIVVGVASLVVMASVLEVGRGVLQASSSEATGDDLITASNDWHVLMNNPDAKKLERADHEALAESTLLPEDRELTATYGMQDRKATYKGQEYQPFTLGVGPASLSVFKLSVAKGRAFTDAEYGDASRIVLVGAQALDGKVEPGDVVRVEGHPFTVVGVLGEKAEMGPGGPWSWNKRVIFPAETYRINFDPSLRPTNIVMRVSPPADYAGLLKDYVLATRNVVDSILMRDRTVKSYELGGVSDDSSTEALIMNTIQGLLYLTTLFSMIVGGINIMNIMLVTVVERTREIGLRRALGATRSAIMSQFLSETVAITLVGAAIGLGGAIGFLALGSWIMTTWVTAWPFRVEAWSIALGLGFSSAIGLVFGLYPAWRASRLDPVEALRFSRAGPSRAGPSRAGSRRGRRAGRRSARRFPVG